MEALKRSLLDWAINQISGFDGMAADAMAVLVNPPWNESQVWNNMIYLSTLLRPFCYLVIGICMLFEIAQVAMKVDMVKWEHGLKLAIKMVFAKVCIDEAPRFLRACYRQAATWIAEFAGNNAHIGSIGDMFTQGIKDRMGDVTGLWEVFFLVLVTVVALLVIKVCGLMIYAIAFGRMFELYVYLVVSPFPLAFFPLGNGNGDGVSRITQKYIKSFIAICLQGLLMIICIKIFYLIIGSTMQVMIADAMQMSNDSVAVSELIFTMLTGVIVLTMSVARCGGWAKNIVDAV